MILADKIILLRKKNGWSQEDLADQLNVSRQSISKWEGAQSIPAMDKIISLSEIFEVSTDFLLKDSLELAEYVEVNENIQENNIRHVSMEEANEYLDLTKKTAHKVGFGVAMCILSAGILSTINNLFLVKEFSLNENFSSAIGLTVFFIIITFAVIIFIKTGMDFKEYEYLKTDAIDTEYGVSGMVKSKMKAYKETYNRYNIIGVTLCILSVLPVIVAPFSENGFILGLGLLATLTMVAIGVFLFVTAGRIWSSFNVLLQEGEFTSQGKSDSKIFGSIAGIYWLLATALYLFISFYNSDWSRSWIIWPVAGVLFGALSVITNLILRHKK